MVGFVVVRLGLVRTFTNDAREHRGGNESM
jgi:hypothetical protein